MILTLEVCSLGDAMTDSRFLARIPSMVMGWEWHRQMIEMEEARRAKQLQLLKYLNYYDSPLRPPLSEALGTGRAAAQ
jgi:hypothetical protein